MEDEKNNKNIENTVETEIKSNTNKDEKNQTNMENNDKTDMNKSTQTANDYKNTQNKEKKSTKTDKIVITIVIVLCSILTCLLILFGIMVVENAADKPIIYLYPENESEITVKLGNPEKLSCSYPKYEEEGWTVTAKPNGDLTYLKTGRKLYSLYWEGKDTIKAKTKEGFIVKGEDVANFLEEKLEILGLNAIEAEEFIVYWLPKMEKNKYNYVRFATIEEINEYMPLEFSKEPDTLIRVFMQFKALNNYQKVPEQKLTTPERKGFVAVEWGGTELK